MSDSHWSAQDLPDLHDRIIIVTGSNSGIGFEAAKALAAHRAQVIMAVRSLENGEEAAGQIRKEIPQARLDVRRLDLGDLSSVQDFAKAYVDDYPSLDRLINNAGVMAIPRRLTTDGFERQFGTNHLGHFALTGLLLEALIATPESRVVTVSSGLHMVGQIHFDDLMGENSYDKRDAYAQSKLANLLFAYELDRRLKASGASVISLGAHPGYAATRLQERGPQMEGSTLRGMLMQFANSVFAQSAAMGALPLLYGAFAPGLHGGEYIGPGGMVGMRGYPEVVKSSASSHDEDLAARLWAVSEELTGVKYTALDMHAEQTQVA
jgi:NAD(P)-dependent dehydrogenase (short-subunit alcohol dehydrogenase family)